MLLTGPWGENSHDIFIKMQQFSFKKMHLKMSSGKWWQFCLSLNVFSGHVPYPLAVLQPSVQLPAAEISDICGTSSEGQLSAIIPESNIS